MKNLPDKGDSTVVSEGATGDVDEVATGKILRLYSIKKPFYLSDMHHISTLHN